MASVIPVSFLSSCDNIKKYKTVETIRKGVYGHAYKAEHKQTKNFVTVKKLANLELPNVASSTYRRISILRKCKHKNIIRLIKVCKLQKKDSINLFSIFPNYDYDLSGLIRNSEITLEVPIVKNIMSQLLSGISYIHANNIIHRDLKPSNIFVSKDGILKIGDLGLMCNFLSCDSISYSNEAESFWYRAPEVLLRSRRYDRSVDMWSVGCIFAELFLRKELFKADCLQEQLVLISDLCGSICPEVWPNVEYLKSYKEMQLPKNLKRNLKSRKIRRSVHNDIGLDLLDQLLVLDPKKRIQVVGALGHKFFSCKPKQQSLNVILSSHQ